MTIEINDILSVSSIFVLVSVLLSKSSNKFGLPILVIFLALGMLAGSEGIGGIHYEDYGLTHSLSLVAICLIIFSGGLMTRKEDIKPVMGAGISLSTLGVVLTTGLVGVFCYYYLSLPIFESLLIGSILSSTDAAAVFTVLRSKNSQVSKKVKSVLELESGSNDPMAYLLLTIFLGLYQGEFSFNKHTILEIILNPTIGIIGGFVFFKLFKFVNERSNLEFQGLYPALTLSFLFLSFSSVTYVNGNGFLAVYIFAVSLGNTKVVHKNSLINFFDGIAWLSQIGLFIMLGLLVFPSRLMEIAPEAITVALFLAIVARPVSIFISTMFSDFNFKSKIFISWAGLKGATPIVFASLVATKVGSEAHLIFDIVFFSVFTSALLQGMTLRPLARALNLLYEAIDDPDFPVDMEVLDKTKNGIKQLCIEKDDFAVTRRVVDLNLSEGVLVLFIKRSGSFIVPNGSTCFEEQDKVLIVSPEKKQIDEVIKKFKEAPEDNILEFSVAHEEEENEQSDELVGEPIDINSKKVA